MAIGGQSRSAHRCQELKPPQGWIVNEILDKYGLSRSTTTQYIDAITRMNQTQTAEQFDVSRDTINRYKNTFHEMNAQERRLLIASPTQDKLLQQTTKER